MTSNKNKVDEILSIISGSPLEIYWLNIEKLEIQSSSLEEISLYAARHAFEIARKPLVVDDSGLFVEALNGFPGPYSSYVYKTLGIKGILKLLENEGNRRACFRTSAALILPPLEKVFTGETCGTITYSPRGSGGFGFDPIFVPDGENRTYAEMSVEEKNIISHRGKAFKALTDYVEGLLL
ncbi:MAG: XTP/dITP diphosphatase [Desulfurococcales archaeon]|nr:XTP/dITP diphosphatase [Desulfurococcales archaeon]